MGAIAARALGRIQGEQAGTEPPLPERETPRRSSLRRKLQGGGDDEPRNEPAEPSAPPLPDTEEPGLDTDPLAGQLPEALVDEGGADTFSGSEATPFDDDYVGGYGEGDDPDDVSQFDYRAPFTARRNPLKMWTAAAAVFAFMATGTVFAVNYYGLPDWLPFERPTFGIGKPDLELDFPKADQREETLDTGEQIFRVRGAINNSGRETVSVPRMIVVFVDERDREVFSKVIAPAKSELAPGESLRVTEAISDYPEAAAKARIGWSPN